MARKKRSFPMRHGLDTLNVSLGQRCLTKIYDNGVQSSIWYRYKRLFISREDPSTLGERAAVL